jgi:hypothetical protein
MLQSEFNGQPTFILENKFVRLEFMASSPRIVRFNPIGKPNMFADLGNESAKTPYGDFYFRGGHRLWHSPEAMPRTYIPDNEGATVSEIPGGVRIDQPSETWTHITKSIEIRLNPNQPQVILRHELRNDGPWEHVPSGRRGDFPTASWEYRSGRVIGKPTGYHLALYQSGRRPQADLAR